MISFDRPDPSERESAYGEIGYDVPPPIDYSDRPKPTTHQAKTEPTPEPETEALEGIEPFDPHPQYVKDFIATREEEFARGVGDTDLAELGLGVPSLDSVENLHKAIAARTQEV